MTEYKRVNKDESFIEKLKTFTIWILLSFYFSMIIATFYVNNENVNLGIRIIACACFLVWLFGSLSFITRKPSGDKSGILPKKGKSSQGNKQR
jgi:hypothetical protein